MCEAARGVPPGSEGCPVGRLKVAPSLIGRCVECMAIPVCSILDRDGLHVCAFRRPIDTFSKQRYITYHLHWPKQPAICVKIYRWAQFPIQLELVPRCDAHHLIPTLLRV